MHGQPRSDQTEGREQRHRDSSAVATVSRPCSAWTRLATASARPGGLFREVVLVDEHQRLVDGWPRRSSDLRRSPSRRSARGIHHGLHATGSGRARHPRQPSRGSFGVAEQPGRRSFEENARTRKQLPWWSSSYARAASSRDLAEASAPRSCEQRRAVAIGVPSGNLSSAGRRETTDARWTNSFISPAPSDLNAAATASAGRDASSTACTGRASGKRDGVPGVQHRGCGPPDQRLDPGFVTGGPSVLDRRGDVPVGLEPRARTAVQRNLERWLAAVEL